MAQRSWVIGVTMVSYITDMYISLRNICAERQLKLLIIGLKGERISVVYLCDLKPDKKKQRWLQGEYPYVFAYSNCDHVSFNFEFIYF